MALIQVNLLSKALMRTVPVNVILPVDKMVFPGMKPREDKPYKTLYLLHGIFGNYTDWVTGTRIQRFAEEHDLCVVMPSGDNSFYVDTPYNHYGEFIGRELVELTRKMFPLSHEKEDTFIGGLSMGGFGALRNGLKYADTFGYIVSLSGACNLEEQVAREGDKGFILFDRSYSESIFGDLTKVLESDKNPKFLARRMHDGGTPMPKIYMACGDKDSLLPCNRDMVQALTEQGADVTFEVGPGDHEWNFWDAYIEKAIDWLPTEKPGLGMNSGNVGI